MSNTINVNGNEYVLIEKDVYNCCCKNLKEGTNTIDELSKEIKAVTGKCNELQSKLEQANNKIEEYQIDLDQRKADIDKKDKEIEKLQADNDKAKEDLNNANSKLESFQKMMQNFGSVVSTITNVPFLGVDIKQMEEFFSAVIDAVKKMAQSSVKSEANIVAKDNGNEDNNVLEDQVEDYKATIDASEEEIDKENGETVELKEENEVMQKIAKSNGQSEVKSTINESQLKKAENLIKQFVDIIELVTGETCEDKQAFQTLINFVDDNFSKFKTTMKDSHEIIINTTVNKRVFSPTEKCNLKKGDSEYINRLTKKTLKIFVDIVSGITKQNFIGSDGDFDAIKNFIDANINTVNGRIESLKTESSKSGNSQGGETINSGEQTEEDEEKDESNSEVGDDDSQK